MSTADRVDARLGSYRHKLLVGVDQLLSSVTNFIASILAAGLLTASGFGSYSLAFAAYLVAVGLNRAWTGEVLMVRRWTTSTQISADGTRASILLGGAGALGIAALAVTPAVSQTTRECLLALAVCSPVLIVHDTHRYTALIRRPLDACAIDAAWLVWSATALIVLRAVGSTSPALAVLAWGSGSLPGATVGYVAAMRHRTTAARRWLSSSMHLSVRFTAEFLIGSASGFLMLTAVVAVGQSTEDVGAIRGALTIMGPLTVLFTASTLYVQPLMSERIAKGHSPRPIAVRQSVGASCLAAVAVAGALVLPDEFGERLLGDTWAGARETVGAVGVAMIGVAVYLGGTNELRALHQAQRALAARTIAAMLTLLATIGGTLFGGPGWTLPSFAVSILLAGAAPWVALRGLPARSDGHEHR